MTHVTCRLTAKNRDQLRNPTLGNRVWAAFTLECFCAGAQSGEFSYTIYVHIFDRGIFLSLDNSYWSKVPERLSPGFTGNCPNVSQCELFAHQSSPGCSDALLDNRRHDSTRRAELYIAARAAWKNRGKYRGWNDVTESMVTTRSPFCGIMCAGRGCGWRFTMLFK